MDQPFYAAAMYLTACLTIGAIFGLAGMVAYFIDLIRNDIEKRRK